MKTLLGLVQSAPCRVDVEFKDAAGKPYSVTRVLTNKKGDKEEVPVFAHKDTLRGEVRVTPLTNKKLEHQSIKVQLLGQIDLASERSVNHDFVSLVRELSPPGELNSAKVYPFEFRDAELQYDSFKGQAVRCRYLLRVTVTGKGMVPDSKRDFPLWVTNYETASEPGPPIKMEVGIEDCLHIEFEYDKARYHMQDVVLGRIYFLLVRIKLKHMEIEIRRKETTGAGTAAHSESETLAKYEIMDGAPVRGESVPIRLYLSPYDLAPTYRDIHNKYSVRYYLNLVLVDEEDRRYFKQQEITLYRQLTGPSAAEGGASGHTGIAPGPPKLASSMQPELSHAAAVNGSSSGAPGLSPHGGAQPLYGVKTPAAEPSQGQHSSQQPPPPMLPQAPAPTPASPALTVTPIQQPLLQPLAAAADQGALSQGSSGTQLPLGGTHQSDTAPPAYDQLVREDNGDPMLGLKSGQDSPAAGLQVGQFTTVPLDQPSGALGQAPAAPAEEQGLSFGEADDGGVL